VKIEHAGFDLCDDLFGKLLKSAPAARLGVRLESPAILGRARRIAL
jgi:hypothetical protein